MNIEQLERELLALVKAAGEENENARQRAALAAMGSLIRRAVETGATSSTLVSIVARNLGVSTRRARELLQKYELREANPGDIQPGHARPGLEDKPRSQPTARPTIGTVKSPTASSSLTSGSMKSSSASSAPMASDGKSLPPLPADLMPRDGQMPPVPADADYRIEHRADGMDVFVINGDRYSLLPGLDPTAPYGRYVDGRPMNEYGAPIGEGPPVIRGKFIGENF
jgi:hypothetical protein